MHLIALTEHVTDRVFAKQSINLADHSLNDTDTHLGGIYDDIHPHFIGKIVELLSLIFLVFFSIRINIILAEVYHLFKIVHELNKTRCRSSIRGVDTKHCDQFSFEVIDLDCLDSIIKCNCSNICHNYHPLLIQGREREVRVPNMLIVD